MELNKLKKFLLIASTFTLASCGLGTSVKPVLDERPKFVAADENFRWYQGHMKGDRFELFTAPTGEQFVMLTQRSGNSMALPLVFITVREEYGMMLDKNLCSTGFAAVRGGNSKSVSINVTPSWDKNIREEVPVGVCFTRL